MNRTVSLAALLLVFAVSLAGCSELLGVDLGGGGGGGGPNKPVPVGDLDGIQAFGTVVRGSDGVVRARLDVVTMKGEPRHLTGIVDPRVRVGSTSISMATTGSVGAFEISSRQAPALQYRTSETYGFTFRVLDNEGQEHSYSGEVRSPSTTPVIEIPDHLVRFAREDVEVDLFDRADGGLLRVFGPNGVTIDTAAISTLGELNDFRTYLERVLQPTLVIDGAAFPTPGTYRVEFTALALTPEGQAGASPEPLGTLSFFGAGSTASVTLQVE